MEIGAVLTFIRDYADLAIGVLFLAVATWVLPARMRAYVLTAGLAVIAYEAYLRATNRKALAAADEERKKLKARAADLDQRREDLEKEVAGLDRQLAENKAKLAGASQETEDVQRRGAEAAGRLARASEDAARHSQENQALLQTLSSKQAQLAILDEAKHAIEEMNAVKP